MSTTAFIVVLVALGCAQRPPLLEQLSGSWQNITEAAGVLHGLKMPGTSNCWGSVAAGRSHNVLSLEYLTMPPITSGGELLSLSMNGRPVLASAYQWTAFGFLRTARVQDVEITTEVRMPFEAKGVLLRTTVNPRTTQTQPLTITISVPMMLRKWSRADNCSWQFPTDRRDNCWNWYAPRPDASADFGTRCSATPTCTIRDSKSAAVAVVAPVRPTTVTESEVTFVVDATTQRPTNVDVVLAFGDDLPSVERNASAWVAGFDRVFTHEVEVAWQQRFDDAFAAKSAHFSGRLPLLETDDVDLGRIYYMSVLSLLHNERTNLPPFSGSRSNRVFGVGGYDNATTNQFWWDYSYYPRVMALLDPVVVEDSLVFYLSAPHEIHGNWGVDYMSQHSVGAWYAANDVSLSQYIHAYLGISGDRAFLGHSVANNTIYRWLDEMANYWRKLRTNADMLADYGGPHQLLECVPSYIHKVAAFNAANVWMMDRLAMLSSGDGATENGALRSQFAASLANDSVAVAQAVLGLYREGQGFFACRYPNGSMVDVRHVVDFVYVLAFMDGYMPDAVKNQMFAFCQSELITPHWMRALSLRDAYASQSDRSDHGPNGAYVGWPPLTVNAYGKLKKYREAVDFLRRSIGVTWFGPYGQAIEVRPPLAPYKPDVFTQWVQAVGASFADCIIATLFGFDPALGGSNALVDASTPRGFEGRLRGVVWANVSYDILSDASGLRMVRSPATATAAVSERITL